MESRRKSTKTRRVPVKSIKTTKKTQKPKKSDIEEKRLEVQSEFRINLQSITDRYKNYLGVKVADIEKETAITMCEFLQDIKNNVKAVQGNIYIIKDINNKTYVVKSQILSRNLIENETFASLNLRSFIIHSLVNRMIESNQSFGLPRLFSTFICKDEINDKEEIVTFEEYVGTWSLKDFVNSKNLTSDTMCSLYCQLVYIIFSLMFYKGISQGDIHDENVRVSKTSYDYIRILLPKSDPIYIPTNGYMIHLIDFDNSSWFGTYQLEPLVGLSSMAIMQRHLIGDIFDATKIFEEKCGNCDCFGDPKSENNLYSCISSNLAYLLGKINPDINELYKESLKDKKLQAQIMLIVKGIWKKCFIQWYNNTYFSSLEFTDFSKISERRILTVGSLE